MDGLRALGAEVWFNLGDRDLAWCLERARMLGQGLSPTAALARLNEALGVRARVLPMSDDRVRTRVLAHGDWRSLQEFLIRDRGAGPVEGVEFGGADEATPAVEVLEALASARAIVIGPSNPVISIGPILAVPGVREALRDAPAPVVAVSPLVRGEVLKGPTEVFLEWAGYALDADGIAVGYDGVIDGLVADQRTDRLPVLETDVLMADADGRRRVAEAALGFAEALR
jgi:LPPG:FO 2-phospho-L-lactate transferase